MARIIGLYTMKGGTGKTTLSVNLSHCSAVHSGFRTLLWDVDAQGSASYLLGQDHAPAKAASDKLARIPSGNR